MDTLNEKLSKKVSVFINRCLIMIKRIRWPYEIRNKELWKLINLGPKVNMIIENK